MPEGAEFDKAGLISFLEEGVIYGWLDKESQKNSSHIVSRLLECVYEVDTKQKVSVDVPCDWERFTQNCVVREKKSNLTLFLPRVGAVKLPPAQTL